MTVSPPGPPPEPSPPDFLGRGWAFPVDVEDDGRIALAGADEGLRQSIRSILSTVPPPLAMTFRMPSTNWSASSSGASGFRMNSSS